MTESRTFLADENADGDGINERWAASNEQWWDWYMSLAFDAGGDRTPVAAPPLPVVVPDTLRVLQDRLDAPYPLPNDACAAFARDGFVKLPDVFHPASLAALRAEWAPHLEAVGEAAMRFPSLEMLWTSHPVSRAFAISRRLGAIAAGLLGVERVRLYHDNALAKLPGCGRTPWHYDAHHYPIASDDVVTLWAPLQPTPRAMGPLAFAKDREAWRLVADLPFSKFDDSYDRGIAEALRRADVAVEDGGFALGEASFHHTRSLHTAGPNRTDAPRLALALTYLADGARLVDSPTLISGDYDKFMPGVGPGDVIASDLNPVVVDLRTFGGAAR